MKNYFIKIAYRHPYPIEANFQTKGVSFAVGISRAVKKWRKENPRIIIKEIKIQAQEL